MNDRLRHLYKFPFNTVSVTVLSTSYIEVTIFLHIKELYRV